ncbi:MAG: transcription-repair coupling factor [Verrucomicrobia bacterium]|nr:transcription-repair coupling factor [Verrucomicrobiota bacterium]NBR62867.1 transcription-repair coupling factor [Verrucomicrobiota bacterium]
MQTQGTRREENKLLDTAGFERFVSGGVTGGVWSFAGWPTGAQALAAQILAQRKGSPGWVLVAEHIRQQEELAAEIESWGGEVVVIPEAFRGSEKVRPDPDLEAEWVGSLARLTEQSSPRLVLVTERVLSELLPPPDWIRGAIRQLAVGETLDPLRLVEKLVGVGYRNVGTVMERGEVARRGGIVDVFSRHSLVPVRLEWSGNRLDSIREIDLHEQTGIAEREETGLFFGRLEEAKRTSGLVDYLGAGWGKLTALTESEEERLIGTPVRHGFVGEPIREAGLAEARRRRVGAEVRSWLSLGWSVTVTGLHEGEVARLQEWLRECDLGEKDVAGLDFRISRLGQGFAWPEGKRVVVTGAELLGRTETRRSLRKSHAGVAVECWRRPVFDPGDLKLGDYAVHLQHGIGIYEGLGEKPGGQGQCLLLKYADGARLYVPVEESYLVSRYMGVGRKRPILDALGGNRWEKAKAKAAKAVEDFAATLLRTAAEREALPGTAFPPDHEWQGKFESEFVYEPTPDQLRAFAETKADMERSRPMDRLICGDVGYGKTEVAIRSIFKAVMAGRQVVFLAPTTVLAQQHVRTLRERFADWPITVEELSRFRSAGEQTKVIRALADGTVDVVVGTHRLLSPDVTFRDLGLVVIDEEQRFGVKQKERYKERFRRVDVLTLSATPIPRTLYLAMLGARDLSQIETAPPGRHPIETIVADYDERLVREWIRREMARGGQVYYLHNRVAALPILAKKLKDLVPGARVEIAHGQMGEAELEEAMGKFVRGRADVLICTTIVESGLDIPNANTIILDRADRFGLADLYQLRGRVGRAQSRAYALLLVPRERRRGEAGERVEALQMHGGLGAGYRIAMRDLEIRGAGNLLGTEQSGHVAVIGFELYCRLLRAAVTRMKKGQWRPPPLVQLRLDFLTLRAAEAGNGVAGAYIPASYVPEVRERIDAYRQVAEAEKAEELGEIGKVWRDRYGPWPVEATLLLGYHRVRVAAGLAGVTRLETDGEKIRAWRGGELEMEGTKLPRLTGQTAPDKLRQLEGWLR